MSWSWESIFHLSLSGNLACDDDVVYALLASFDDVDEPSRVAKDCGQTRANASVFDARLHANVTAAYIIACHCKQEDR